MLDLSRKHNPNRIYLDSNAGAILDDGVRARLAEALEWSGNPSSAHSAGQRLSSKLFEARASFASAIGASTNNVFFTSSGTEANQWVIREALTPSPATSWATTKAEHDSIAQMATCFAEPSYIRISNSGVIDPDSFRNAIGGADLVSIGWVNGETGVIQDVQSLSEIAHSMGVRVHVDAAQALGKIAIDVRALQQIDFMTFSGHKVGALPGIGAVWAREPGMLAPNLLGNQEDGFRGGTENFIGIHSLGLASAQMDHAVYSRQVAPLRAELERQLTIEFEGIRIHGAGAMRVANTTYFSIPGVSADILMAGLDQRGIAVSMGSACKSGIGAPSDTLLAMGCDNQESRNSIRVSLGTQNTISDIEALIGSMRDIIDQMRSKQI